MKNIDLFLDDPFVSKPSRQPPSMLHRWLNRLSKIRRHRVPQPRITLLRIVFLLLLTAILCVLRRWTQQHQPYTYNGTPSNARYPFRPSDSGTTPLAVDTFADYKHRGTCNVSALDLHVPSRPLCRTRSELLAAMSGGGRIGFDAPYSPRGCDMRWFTTDEVCAILSRFDRVVLVGDSMLRHVIGSVNILIRKDIGYGAVTDWNFSPQEKKDCFCNEQFDVRACSVQGIYKTADVLKHDPKSVKCSKHINVIMEGVVQFPIPEDELGRLRESIGEPSLKMKAFVLGHGLWSNLDMTQSLNWMDKILDTIRKKEPSDSHMLFVTPNAAGKDKPDQWILSQGNKALMLFENAMGYEAKKRGLEHLGTWNMSIQANTYDGVHMDMKGNLVKAMMVINWLNMLE